MFAHHGLIRIALEEKLMNTTQAGLAYNGFNPHHAADAVALQPRSYDHWHVDLNERWEIDFWMKHLGCNEDELRQAVF